MGANKNSIKIIGEDTANYAQGYFVYDSKKSGSITTSHLRFGPKPIRSCYLITRANFVACHQFNFLERIDVLRHAEPGAVFLLNSPFGKDEVWDHLPRPVQEQIIRKKLQFYVIDGYSVAKETGMGLRINTVMQTCFFAISGVLPREEAIAAIKKAIKKTYGSAATRWCRRTSPPSMPPSPTSIASRFRPQTTSHIELRPPVSAYAPAFVQDVLAPMILGDGDDLPVSKLPADGTYPTGTAAWEKRNIALADSRVGRGALHPVRQVRPGLPPRGHPRQGLSQRSAGRRAPGLQVRRAQVEELLRPEVTPCRSRPKTAPAALSASRPARPSPRAKPSTGPSTWSRSLRFASAKPTTGTSSSRCPRRRASSLALHQVKDVQLLQSLFEFSGACAGCGETPYIKLLTQLFGDRAVIANATGCSSIYGGNLPTTPYTTNKDGRGVAWSNSLFEDNAEFGLGIRLSIDKQRDFARELLIRLGWTAARRAGEGHPRSGPEQAKPPSPPSAPASSSSSRQLAESRHARSPRPARYRRHAGGQVGLDRRRRRLGL